MKLDFPDETTIDQVQLTTRTRVLLSPGPGLTTQECSGSVTHYALRSGQVRSGLLLGRSLGP